MFYFRQFGVVEVADRVALDVRDVDPADLIHQNVGTIVPTLHGMELGLRMRP